MARTIPTPEVNEEALRFLASASGMPESDVFSLTCLVMIDRHLNDDKVLRGRTGTEREEFDLLYKALIRHMDKDPKSALYWGKAGCEDSAGRRCAMAPRHMLFMYLEYARGGMSQECVANAYGISQTSASRYFSYVQTALAGLPTTADNLAADLKKAKTPEEVQQVAANALTKLEKAAGVEPGSAGKPGKTLPGNILMHDGTHVPKERAKDENERDASYSGKKKTYTNNVVVTTSRDGLAVGVSAYAPGSTNDITLMRESEPDLGLVTQCLKGESDAMKMREFVDKGFRGLQKHHPGSKIMMPLPRKKSKTKAAKAHNRLVNRIRVVIEHFMRWVKRYRRMRDRVRRVKGKEREAFIVITGLVNLHLLMGLRDKARNHRKGKKPGPKTARSRS